MDSSEEWPSCINTSRGLQNLYVAKDKLTVKYVGQGTGTKDVGCVQANLCVPRQELAFYFEVTVKDAGERGRICIGLSDARFPQGRLPGWESNSLGYHADDGHKYYGGNDGAPYGPTFGTNDVVGACINLRTRQVFFTKNGKHLGIAFSDVPTIPLYPTVGLHSLNACCVLNFGQTPFRFDIEGYRQAEMDAMRKDMQRAPLPAGISHDLVRQYLVFHGYAETLGVFDRTAGYAPVCTSDAHTATNDTHAMNDTHTTNDTHGPNDTRAPCGGNAGGEGHDGVHNGEGVEDMGVDGEERQGGGGPAAAAASTSGRNKRRCPEEASLHLRWKLRHLLKQGDLDAAQHLLQQHVPHLLQPITTIDTPFGGGVGGSGGEDEDGVLGDGLMAGDGGSGGEQIRGQGRATGARGSGGGASGTSGASGGGASGGNGGNGDNGSAYTRGRVALKFWLDLQSFVELIRRGDVDQALLFAQHHLAPYRNPDLLDQHVCHAQLSLKEAQAFLEEVVALIAYPDPATCSCGWILGQPQRERVADIANRAVLEAMWEEHGAGSNGVAGHDGASGSHTRDVDARYTTGPPRSAFERVLQHLKVVDDELFENNGQQGPRINLFEALRV